MWQNCFPASNAMTSVEGTKRTGVRIEEDSKDVLQPRGGQRYREISIGIAPNYLGLGQGFLPRISPHNTKGKISIPQIAPKKAR
jgi:hypothetical protein